MLWWTLRQLKSEDSRAAERAALELGAAKEPRAVEPLLEALGSRHERVRHAAAVALARIGDQRAVGPLVEAFRRRPSEAYADALVLLKDRRALPALCAALIHEQESVRELAAVAIQAMEAGWAQAPEIKAAAQQYLDALHDPRPDVKRAALELLNKIGEPRTAAELMRVIESEPGAGGWGVRELEAINPEWTSLPQARVTVEPLIAILKRRDFEGELAAATLARIGDPRAVGPLIDALRDRDRGLRNAAARALGVLGDRQAIGPLVAAPLNGLLDPWVARQALNAIDPKWATSEEARPVLPACISKLADRDSLLREYAETVLALIDPRWPESDAARDAVPMLQQMAGHSDPMIRDAALRTLQRISRGG